MYKKIKIKWSCKECVYKPLKKIKNFFYEKYQKNKKHRNTNYNQMKKINNKRLMVTCSIMKFEMPCFSVNKNRSHNKIKLYLDGVLG